MSDQPNNQPDPNRPLSEISHLFLSSIRDRQTGGAPRPVRKPPTAANQTPAEKPVEPNLSIDLTPEEFAQVSAEGGKTNAAEEKRPQVSAVIAAHLNGRQVDRVREYASHLAATHGRIGLIELDASEFRVMLFERTSGGANVESTDAAFTAPERLDPRRMAEALEELNWDVDRWVLLLPSIRTPEARELLGAVDHWTLLATCDHDGVVSCYRSLKGLADLARREDDAMHPILSLALLDVRSLDEADRVTLKLAGVCQQFLDWPLESEPVVRAVENVADHLVLCCRAGKDTATTSAPQFRVVQEFLTRSAPMEQAIIAEPVVEPAEPVTTHVATAMPPAAAVQTSAASVASSMKIMPEAPQPMVMEMRLTDSDVSEVIDLAGDEASPAAVVSAVIKGGSGLAETPLKAPMCASASLAVSRERKLVLVAVARQGLCDLRDIAQAYRWMNENGQLIAMALPQFAIEPNSKPRLQLLVDQADLSAEVLQPLLQSSHVTVQTYRKLRWGGKTGLLLEAA